ncbi:MAG: DUF4364 family protein [Christensenellales bacterium]
MIQYASNETTGKLILLYVLDKMECELTEDTIIDMCYYQKKWVSYFTCKIALSELTKSGFIKETKTSEQSKYYSITSDGRSCLSYFFDEIPTSTKNEIADFIRDNKLDFKRKQEYFSDSFKNKDGLYTVILKIVEPNATNLEIKLTVPEQSTAKDIQKNWQDNASRVYANIFDLLLQN